MKFIKEKSVKEKLKNMGFRSGNGLTNVLDVMIDTVLERATEYVKPQKTMNREDMMAYLERHKIKI